MTHSVSSFQPHPWADAATDINGHLSARLQQTLESYRADPILVDEHANIERSTAQGGYGRRQLYELIQNGADALAQEGREGRIHVILTGSALYCANEGASIDKAGVDAILHSHMSMKRGTEIGRFGLGFKSVLGVTDAPEFYGRSGSFRFSATTSEALIRQVVPHAKRYPVLRIAEPLDSESAFQRDSVLRELSEWATTIVRLPRTLKASGWLPDDIRTFPAEFPLFSPHVSDLRLEDRTDGRYRIITLGNSDGFIELREGQHSSRWRVFSVQHIPSAAARADGGELADREVLPLMWAVPVQRQSARGRFWAFFPTEYLTTLSGIVNAPWKTNEDRQNLLPGAFNEELIDATANLIVSNLQHLVPAEEPGRYLELLPARSEDAPNWADRRLTEAVYQRAARAPSIPDQNGVLRPPEVLRLHPTGLPRQVLNAWSAVPSRPSDWVHPSVDSRDTRARVERVFTLAGRSAASLVQWLEALVHPATAETSLAALEIAAMLVKTDPVRREQVRWARIVMTWDGRFVTPGPGTVFIPALVEAPPTDITTVHPFLAQSEAARAALEILGIRTADASAQLEALLVAVKPEQMPAADQIRLWAFVDRTNEEDARTIITRYFRDTTSVPVMTLSGRFHPIRETLLPGAIVSMDGARDADVTIDLHFHKNHGALIRALGGVSEPQAAGGHTREAWYSNYSSEMRADYLSRLLKGRPQERYIRFEVRSTAGPLDILTRLSDQGRAIYTRHLLQLAAGEPGWKMRHESRPGAYPVVTYESPSLWAIRREGRLNTSLGFRPVAATAGEGLRKWERFLPVSEEPAVLTKRLGLPERLQDLSDRHLQAGLAEAAKWENVKATGEFYAAICRLVNTPAQLACMTEHGWGTCPPGEVTVATAQNEIAALTRSGHAFTVAPSKKAATELVEAWGLRRAEETLTIEVIAVPAGEAIPLTDEYPALTLNLRPADVSLRLIRCSAIRVETITTGGRHSEERKAARDHEVIYVSDDLDAGGMLEQIGVLLGLDLSADERARILERRERAQHLARRETVLAESDLADKLVAAVGGEAILRRLPAGLIAATVDVKGNLSTREAADLALAVYGVETLRVFRHELAEQGFAPPLQWAGSRAARLFVEDLGFPAAYAGFERAQRGPFEDVRGAPNLPPLHDYQKIATASIRSMLKESGARRGLLALPTGAGKTRVAVEALILAHQQDGLEGPILWVAQSDELCEQAVQTWQFLWRALGGNGQLRVNRLWGANEADRAEGVFQVVVATIQKLQGRAESKRYGWLRFAGCVVIDEAHHSIAPSYTAVLEWLGLSRSREERPLLGLTATAFRGGVEETQRLVYRYGHNRLDAGIPGDDPYATLQERGILSRVDHRLLQGVNLDLYGNELRDLERTLLIPASVEQRIGDDTARNERLLTTVTNLPPDWPVLLFAASVDHAQTMAALLQTQGVSAAAVSAYTDMRTRQYYVERFRAGELRVLTNYAVLTTGFDAPAIRAVIVARPTYSPVLYQQMIGRGLRGPLNGGKERCLIVNVADNLVQFGANLAFREFEYLWQKESGAGPVETAL